MRGVISMGDLPSDLADMLSGAMGAAKKANAGVTTDPEAQIMSLHERLAVYKRHMQDGYTEFKIGDLVTPRPGNACRYSGIPHIVLEIKPMNETEPHSVAEAGSSANGRRCNMRVCVFTDNDDTSCFTVESWEYDLYEGK